MKLTIDRRQKVADLAALSFLALGALTEIPEGNGEGGMSQAGRQGEVNRLLGEKEHLKKEEAALRKIIDSVKKQVAALQIEQLEIKNRMPLSRVSPSWLLQPPVEEVQEQEPEQVELNLEVLHQLHSGTFAVEQEEEED